MMSKGAYDAMMMSIAKIDASLAICNMNNKVGYGIYTLAPIPANTWVMIYGGLYHPIKTPADIEKYSGVYSFAIGTIMHGMINAELIGGKARFVQYAPAKVREEDDDPDTALALADYTFDKSINVNDVAYANAICEMLNYKGKEFLAYKTIEEIPANHVIFVDYGKLYWLEPEWVPKLFFKR